MLKNDVRVIVRRWNQAVCEFQDAKLEHGQFIGRVDRLELVQSGLQYELVIFFTDPPPSEGK